MTMERQISTEKTDLEVLDDVESSEVASLDPKDDRRLRRKADLYIMPLLCTVYAVQFLDKTALTYSSIMGIIPATKITLAQYSWLGSIFYLGYLVGNYPMCIAQQRLPLAKFTGLNIVIWGVVVCCMAVCKNFAGLMIVRFFLGFFESCVVPACMLFTAQWYRVHEQGTRTGVWTSFATWGGILGSGVAYGLAMGDIHKSLSMAGWKILFIFLGCLTIFVGILFAFLIPDLPEKAWFLTPDEKQVAHLRQLANKQDMGETKWQWYQVREALTDFQVWGITLVALFTAIPNGGITNFYALIVTGFGFKPQETLLMGMANAWLSILTILILWAGDKVRCRSLMSLIPTAMSTIGTIMVWQLSFKEKIGRMVGFYLSLAFSVAAVACVSFIASNVAGRTKKTTCAAMYLIATCAGNLIGPQTFRSKDLPRYAPALIIIVVCNIVVMFLMVGLYVYYRTENAKRNKMAPSTTVADSSADLTDKENKSFRYAY